ncbi:MAG: hypothetical protein ACLP9L_39255, partial [Thermoguttaceae bacterium]
MRSSIKRTAKNTKRQQRPRRCRFETLESRIVLSYTPPPTYLPITATYSPSPTSDDNWTTPDNVSAQQRHLMPSGEDRDEATGVNVRRDDGGQPGIAYDRLCH